MPSEENLLPVGTVMHGCRIVSRIGSGGMGCVYRAHDEGLDRPVAVKIMHGAPDDQTGKARFLREAAAIAKLDHPGIIRIFSYGEFQGHPFFIMELVDGWSIRDFLARYQAIHHGGHSLEDLRLSGYLKESGPATPFFLRDPVIDLLADPGYPARVRRLMTSAAQALAAAHEQGTIHRDVKPSNILICSDEKVKIVDFGLVKQRGDQEITRTGQFLGTLSYAAPEQLMGRRGKITPQTDVYGLGVVLYELATLQHPVREEDPAAIIAAITRGDVRPPRSLNPHISGDLEEIILRCLQTEPDRRFASAADLGAALQEHRGAEQWFAGLKRMVKGWFQPFAQEDRGRENPTPDALPAEPRPAPSLVGERHPGRDSARGAALRFYEAARAKFFEKFAVWDAVEDLKQAYELDPGNADLLFLLSFALNAVGGRSEIRRYLDPVESLIDRSDDKEWGKFQLNREIFLRRDYEAGRKQAIRLNQLYPDDQDVLFGLFFCLEVLGDYSEAIRVGERLAVLAPENNIVAVAQSECYFSVLEFDAAIEVLRSRIARHPEYHNLRLKVVQTLLLRGRIDEASREVEQILAADPGNLFMQLYRGRIWVWRNDLDKAYDAFRQAVGLQGDRALRANGFYHLYRLSELMGRPEQAAKFLRQARDLKDQMVFLDNRHLEQRIGEDSLAGFIEEFGPKSWLDCVFRYARMVCKDSVDIRSYTIGNFGCTSVIEFAPDGSYLHHAVFSHFNADEVEELYSQIWLPEFPTSPFIDQNGNILTSRFHANEGAIGGGIASLTLAEPWKSGRGAHIYCRLANGQVSMANGSGTFQLPRFPILASRRQGFLLVLPAGWEVVGVSAQPEEIVTLDDGQVWCYFPYLIAGEVFPLSVDLRAKPAV